MADKTKSPAYEPGTDYTVTLKKAVKLGRRTLSPMHSYTMKGAALADIPADAIKSAKPKGN